MVPFCNLIKMILAAMGIIQMAAKMHIYVEGHFACHEHTKAEWKSCIRLYTRLGLAISDQQLPFGQGSVQQDN